MESMHYANSNIYRRYRRFVAHKTKVSFNYIFFEGDKCEIIYADRGGKYQNQGSGVTLPKV